jgi:hypothetical protein
LSETTSAQTSGGSDAPADDPVEVHKAFLVAAAVAQKRSELYAADVSVIDEKFAGVAGAQGKYREARTTQQTSFQELTAQVERLKKTVECKVDEATRNSLNTCWTTQLGKEPQAPSCTKLDEAKCEALPGAIADLLELQGQAGTCVPRADKDFDALIDLPAALGDRIDELKKMATELEQEANRGAGDLTRSYVEYLKLNRDFDDLRSVWLNPAEYSRKVKKAFVTLVHRRKVTICVATEVFAREQARQPAPATGTGTAEDIVDLVLECYGSAGQAGQQQYGQRGPGTPGRQAGD